MVEWAVDQGTATGALMDLILNRVVSEADGIRGQLSSNDGSFIANTLEHAYTEGEVFLPKVAEGTYKCMRHAPNRLPYETFELQNVPDFQGKPVTGILLHIGNYNQDSDGCILVGSAMAKDGVTEQAMLLGSKIAFETLMKLQTGVNEFTLVVK